MQEKYFFDIPVYRCNQEKHIIEMQKEKSKLMDMFNKAYVPQEYASETKKDLEYHFSKNIWYYWRYNEIIGWIRLYTLGRQIRGELWWTDAKHILKGNKKKIHYSGKAFEMHLHEKDDSSSIFARLCNEINVLSKEKIFKKRYIDISLLLEIAPYIDWERLVGLN